MLEELAERIKERGGEVGKTHAAVGCPEAEIARIAEHLGVGLVGMGRRSLGPHKRALMESASHCVIRRATVPSS